MREYLQAWRTDEEGLATVEYALLVALVVVSAIGVWTAFGSTVRSKVASSGNSMNGLN